jgi:large subunit ribosomal protein L3
MTRIFTDDGNSEPVTVLDVSNNRVTQIKTPDTDGYSAVQVTFGKRRATRVSKPLAGHFAKASVEAGHIIKEFHVTDGQLASLKTGAVVNTEIFQVGQRVDVTGITIGKGFAGVIKRHHFSSNRASHGNSKAHNKPGSIGMCQDPGRIFPGKRMSGHLGSIRKTTQNLEVLRIDTERGLLLIKGAIPGSKGGDVVVRPSFKITKIKTQSTGKDTKDGNKNKSAQKDKKADA